MPKGFWATRLPLLEVLLLLVLIIVCVSWYGLAATPFVLNDEIRQADVKSLFERNWITPLDSNFIATQNDSALIAAQLREDETVDTSSKYILFCGDSMTEQTRFALEKYAEQNGHKLMTCTWYSSTTKLWSETDRLSFLIKAYKPDIIWFTLGANELFIPAIANREKFMQDIIYEADTAKVPFVWIGPPNWKDDTGINELLAKNLGPTRFYSSAHFREKLQRSSDGAHPTRASAVIWTDSIVAWYTSQSRYKNKILLKDPKDSSSGPPLAYRPKKQACAPERDNKFSVVILKDLYLPVLCSDDRLAVAKTDSLNATIVASVEPKSNKQIPKTDNPKTIVKNNITNQNNNPQQDTTPKTKVSNTVKDSSQSGKVPGDLPLNPNDSTK